MSAALSIMVVDDHQPILSLLKHILEPAGYRVIQASDGAEALSLLENSIPDLILLDITMPKINGLQVLATVRQRSSVPVIMVSAIDEPESVNKAMSLGANGYIRKPFNTLELLERVKSILDKPEGGQTPSH